MLLCSKYCYPFCHSIILEKKPKAQKSEVCVQKSLDSLVQKEDHSYKDLGAMISNHQTACMYVIAAFGTLRWEIRTPETRQQVGQETTSYK